MDTVEAWLWMTARIKAPAMPESSIRRAVVARLRMLVGGTAICGTSSSTPPPSECVTGVYLCIVQDCSPGGCVGSNMRGYGPDSSPLRAVFSQDMVDCARRTSPGPVLRNHEEADAISIKINRKIISSLRRRTCRQL